VIFISNFPTNFRKNVIFKKLSKCFLVVATLITISFLIRLFFIHPTFSDENFYFNAAKQVLANKAPYRDFFFAHPPLQIYFLALLFKIFGASFAVGKISTLIFSSLSAFLIFFLGKTMYDEKAALTAVVFFIITPAFLSFSSMGYGMFEALFFALLSFYLFLKEKYLPSSLSMVLAVMFRYTAFIYILPFLIFWKRKNIKKLFVFLFPMAAFTFIVLLSVFGMEYFKDTVLYHTSLKVGAPQSLSLQYWSFSLPIIFLVLISIIFSFRQKDRTTFYLGLTALVIDFLLLLTLKNIFYHYFIISLPFYMLAIASMFQKMKDVLMKFAIIAVFLLMVFNNFKTIDYYNNPSQAESFKEAADYVAGQTKSGEKIFGEPTLTNYVSFTRGIAITGGYIDSYTTHIAFDGEEKVVEMLSKEKPKIIVEMKLEGNYYYLGVPALKQFIQTHYGSVYNSSGIPEYLVFELRQ